jgi:hypothetical protein
MICAELAVVLHLVSVHTEPGRNNVNLGAGLECPITRTLRAGAGAYVNSWERLTVYAGGSWLPIQAGRFKAGGMLAAGTGYKQADIVPLGGLVAQYGNWRLLAVPKIYPKQSALIHLSYEVRL